MDHDLSKSSQSAKKSAHQKDAECLDEIANRIERIASAHLENEAILLRQIAARIRRNETDYDNLLQLRKNEAFRLNSIIDKYKSRETMFSGLISILQDIKDSTEEIRKWHE